MNPDGKIIPITEDDQGEGMKDPLTLDDLFHLGQEYETELCKKLVKKMFRKGAPEVRWAPRKDFNRHR